MKRGIILKNTKPFSLHFVMLAVLFVLGESIINLPLKNANKLTFLGFIISFLLSLLVFYAVLRVDLLKYPVLFVALYTAGNTFITFLNFISKNLLTKTQNIFILIIFLLPLLYFCFKKQNEILNFSLIAGLLCGGLIIFFFFATFKDFNFKNIYIYSFPNIKNLFSQSIMYIKSVTLPISVLALYAKQIGASKKSAFCGVLVGNLFLLITIFNSILLFGTTLSAKLLYPYGSAISTVTFGNLFSRLDGFSYFIYFVAAAIKITVCIKVIKNLLNSFKVKF